MTQSLGEVFAELGISQYLDAFVDQGFDSWDTILDITEPDLDALDVKLGHRRKLQRRIANSRGFAPDAALVSPIPPPSVEDSRRDAQKPELPKDGNRGDAPTTVVTKRKYRRHPKPDENAPERPPPAYVLFSNKMRDDLKGRNLTFTEIAKLVGENWQSLSQAEKEPYESQAQAAKDKYSHDLAEYKKTPEHRRYMVYLQDFRAKHANQAQEKDASKRVKLSGESSSGSGVSSGGISRSGTGSGSESQVGSEPPPATRQRRVDSTASLADSQHSYAGTYPDSRTSPSTVHADHLLDRSPVMSTSPREIPSRRSSTRGPAWIDGQRVDGASGHHHLPSLSDMFDGRGPMNGVPPPPGDAGVLGNGFVRNYQNNSPGPPRSLISGGFHPPSLRNETSSGGSMSSGGSGGSMSYPRPLIEGSLPIHALLSGAKAAPFEPSTSTNKAQLPPFPADGRKGDVVLNGLPAPWGAGYYPNVPQGYPSAGPAVLHGTTFPSHRSPPNGKDDSNLDGISALLRAREIVDRRNT